jgi:cation-transporting P-type ATPase C
MNIVHVAHELPERTRLYLLTKVNACKIETFVRTLPGVISAFYTSTTGSLLVYHQQKISAPQLKHFIVSFLKKEEQEKKTLWKELVPVAGCLAMFTANFYVQRSPFTLLWKKLFHFGAVVTAVATSFDVIKDGISHIVRKRKGNANTLTAASILASLYIRNPGSALVITMMSTISEMLTDHTSEQTKEYIHSLLELDTSYAWRVNEKGEEVKVPLEEIKKGDTVLVFTGEKIPVDGTVMRGYGTVDESSITGEYMPKEKSKKEIVYAGSILQNGHLAMKVDKVGSETALSKIVKLLEKAQETKAPIQNMADALAEKMVPLSFALSFITFLLTKSMNRAMNMLVIDFICGIKLSTATALYAAIGRAAREGAIVKGSHHIEEMANISTLILDKTGTITEGAPLVQHVLPCDGYSKEDVITFAAAVEKSSSHPIADAIMNQAKRWNIRIPSRDEGAEVQTVVGKGISTVLNGKRVVVGSLRFMNELKIKGEGFFKNIESDENVIYVAYDQALIGVVSIFDKIRSGMHRAIHSIREHGIDDIIMLTGDKRHVAKEMAKRLRLNWYHAEALPEEKASYVERYGKRGAVMMVGDGINDAPALAYANVGVTMGAKRTDIASEASDIVITSDNPEMLSELIGLSKRTMRIIKQNFAATFLINGLAIVLGACGIFSPIIGAAIHNAATIGVVMNSARILWIGGEWNECKVLRAA